MADADLAEQVELVKVSLAAPAGGRTVPVGAQPLLALLALRGRTSRSRLAGTLWPQTTEHRALASLRTGIWRINQCIDGLVTATSDTLDLDADAEVDVRRLVRTAHATMRDRDSSCVEIAAVVDDTGELLPDWDDEWLLAYRERLRQLRLHVLETVADRLAGSGQYGLALEAALAALRVDTARESAHGAVIRVHLAEGNLAEARRAYAMCFSVLVRDVGVEPSPVTTAMLPHPRLAVGSVLLDRLESSEQAVAGRPPSIPSARPGRAAGGQAQVRVLPGPSQPGRGQASFSTTCRA